MKKWLVVPCMVMLVWCRAQTTEGIFFTTAFKPGASYRQTMSTSSKGSIKFSGDAKVLKQMKAQGIDNPKKINSNSVIIMDAVTGKMESDSTFSLVLKMNEIGSEVMKSMDGVVFYAHCSRDSMPVIDSMEAENLSAEMKTNMMVMMKKMFTQISMPSRYIKVGESFTHDIPLSMGTPTVPIQMSVSSTYKLTGIKNGLAYFDIQQTLTMNMEVTASAGTMQLSGTGKGQGVYNVAGKYFETFSTTMTMQGGMEIEGMKMRMKTASASVLKTEYGIPAGR